MSTINYQTEKEKINTEAVLLLEITLRGDGNLTKVLYLADKYITVDGVKYEGAVQSWGGMDVTMYNEGIAAISDYSISLQNKRLNFMTTDVCISDILDTYYWAGSECKVYQWFESLTSKDDAELIFKGIVKQPAFDLNEIKFDIQESNTIHQNIPVDIVTLNNYSEAPEESIDKPLPIVFGDDWEYETSLEHCVFTPCIEVDKNLKTFYIARHLVGEAINIDDCALYIENVKAYAGLRSTNFSQINDSDGAKFTLGDSIYYHIYLIPKIKGSKYTSAVSDYSNALNMDTSDYITLQNNTQFYLKLDSVPNMGHLESLQTQMIRLWVEIGAVTGTAVGGNYGYLRYYNDGYDAGKNPKFSTGTNITAGSNIYIHELVDNREAKGTSDDEDDNESPWIWDQLASMEFGITVENNGGDPITMQLERIVLELDYIPLVYKKPTMFDRIRRIPRP